MNAFDVGDVVQHQTVFTTTAGAVVDPTEVILYLRNPVGAVGTYKYSAGDITTPASGTYRYNGTTTMPGEYNVRWWGTGAAVATEQSRYFVRPVNT